MQITAKFSSTCPACGNYINAGDQVEWTKGTKARHVSCSGGAKRAAAPKAVPAPRKPAVPAITDAPYIRVEKWDPCKRVHLPDTTGDVRVVGVFKRSWASVREGATAEPVLEGDALVVVAQTAMYESAEQNEDMGDMSGPGWHVTLYLRRATAEEAAPALEKAAKARAEREAKVEAAKAEVARKEAMTAEYKATKARLTEGLVVTACLPSPMLATTLLAEDPSGMYRLRFFSTADGGFFESCYSSDDDRNYYYGSPERVRELVIAWAARHNITSQKAREWLEKYRGCEGTSDYEILAEVSS